MSADRIKEIRERVEKGAEEAKRRANALFSNEDVEYKRRGCAFHLGRADAMEEILRWLDDRGDD